MPRPDQMNINVATWGRYYTTQPLFAIEISWSIWRLVGIEPLSRRLLKKNINLKNVSDQARSENDQNSGRKRKNIHPDISVGCNFRNWKLCMLIFLSTPMLQTSIYWGLKTTPWNVVVDILLDGMGNFRAMDLTNFLYILLRVTIVTLCTWLCLCTKRSGFRCSVYFLNFVE